MFFISLVFVNDIINMVFIKNKIYSVLYMILLAFCFSCSNYNQEELIGEIGFSSMNYKKLDTVSVYLDLKEKDTLQFWSKIDVQYTSKKPLLNYEIEIWLNNEKLKKLVFDAFELNLTTENNKIIENEKTILKLEGRNKYFNITKSGEYLLKCRFNVITEEDIDLKRWKLSFKR
jgi:hypothetical protein